MKLSAKIKRQLAFAEGAGYAPETIEPLTADASFRSYSRLSGVAKPALVMDAPPDKENLGQYLLVANVLASAGLRVPEVYASDLSAGLAVIEDFGGDTFTRVLQRGSADEVALYERAAKALAHLHAYCHREKAWEQKLESYDLKALLREVALFADWFALEVNGGSVDSSSREDFISAWSEALAGVAARRDTIVLRDYHVDNLMLVPGETAVLECGQLDFQDALVGARAYDLVSLLEDARRDVSEAARSAALSAYEASFQPEGLDTLQVDMTLLGAQRHTKVLGIFVRLFVRDQKPLYLRHLPRLVRLLSKSLDSCALKAVREATRRLVPLWDDAHIVQSLIDKGQNLSE